MPAPAAVFFKAVLYPPFAATASALALLSPRCKQHEHQYSFKMIVRPLNRHAHGWTRSNLAQIQFIVEYDALHGRQLASCQVWPRARAGSTMYVCMMQAVLCMYMLSSVGSLQSLASGRIENNTKHVVQAWRTLNAPPSPLQRPRIVQHGRVVDLVAGSNVSRTFSAPAVRVAGRCRSSCHYRMLLEGLLCISNII